MASYKGKSDKDVSYDKAGRKVKGNAAGTSSRKRSTGRKKK